MNAAPKYFLSDDATNYIILSMQIVLLHLFNGHFSRTTQVS